MRDSERGRERESESESEVVREREKLRKQSIQMVLVIGDHQKQFKTKL